MFLSELGERIKFDVPNHNPLEQERVRGVNARFVSAKGFRTLLVDPHCDRHIHDFEAVQLGPDGKILKPGGPRAGSTIWQLTHISDGVGYWIDRVTPLGREVVHKSALESIPKAPPRAFKSPQMP